MGRHRGFTLPELVIVMLLMAILAGTAIPRLFDKSGFAARGARDYVGAGLRYAQKAAIAMRRNVCVDIGATSLAVTHAAAAGNDQACGASVANPATGVPFGSYAYENATVATPATVVFDAMGRPMSAPATFRTTALAITVNGHANPVTLEPETGYVR